MIPVVGAITSPFTLISYIQVSCTTKVVPTLSMAVYAIRGTLDLLITVLVAVAVIVVTVVVAVVVIIVTVVVAVVVIFQEIDAILAAA